MPRPPRTFFVFWSPEWHRQIPGIENAKVAKMEGGTNQFFQEFREERVVFVSREDMIVLGAICQLAHYQPKITLGGEPIALEIVGDTCYIWHVHDRMIETFKAVRYR